MTRRTTHDDDDRLPLDAGEARIDALLGEALAPDRPSPDLADRIVAQTLPKLRSGRRMPLAGPVLAVIGAPVFKVAAAIVVVTSVVIALLNAPQSQWELPERAAQAPTLDQIEAQLAAIADAADAPQSELDHRIDLLALQVDLVQHEPLWEDSDAVAEQLLLLYEIDRYVGESSVIF